MTSCIKLWFNRNFVPSKIYRTKASGSKEVMPDEAGGCQEKAYRRLREAGRSVGGVVLVIVRQTRNLIPPVLPFPSSLQTF